MRLKKLDAETSVVIILDNYALWYRKQQGLISIFFRHGENKGSAASSRSGQRSSALHLEGFESCV